MVECQDAAKYAGMAHLLNFRGTDTCIASRAIKYYYNDVPEGRAKSVWATEHSIATAFGLELEDEIEYVLTQLDRAPDDAIVSLVCDSKDTFRFANKVMGDPRVMKVVKARKGRTVCRPDSGDPKAVVNRLLNILGEVYGYTYNDKGYKVLKHNVGVLQGDGMEYNTINDLYESILTNGWSADNLVVGSGGGLLQKWNRDTQRFAIKASKGWKGEKSFDIYKECLTAGTGADQKSSKRGELKVIGVDNNYTTISDSDMSKSQFTSYVDRLEVIFHNGVLVDKVDFMDLVNR